jgi:hypothetical protein
LGQKPKTSKGEISISNFQGRIRLRWRYGGEWYSLNLPYAYLSENLLEKWINALIDQVAQKVNAENWAVTTYNRRPKAHATAIHADDLCKIFQRSQFSTQVLKFLEL